MAERELKRYSAYFRGWCQAFGEHECIEEEESDNIWLIAEQQVGLVLPRPMIRPLYREVLLHDEVPSLTLSPQGVQVGSFHLQISKACEKQAVTAIHSLFEAVPEMHLYLTSHLLYGSGNRIITFSSKKPLSIIYKEIGTMKLLLV